MLKLLAQFVLSGSIVVLASFAAPKFGQKWSGLIVAAPLLTLLTFIFLSLDPASGNLREYLTSALIYMIPAAIFILCLLLLSPHVHFVLNILVSFVVFGIVAVALYKFRTL